MRRLAIYFLLLLAGTSAAQKNFVPGYIITLKGDTLKGKIKDRKYLGDAQSWQKIHFSDTLGRRFVYRPEDIREYGRRGHRYRTLVIGVEGKPTFVELIEEGAVLLYAWNRGSWSGAGNAIIPSAEKKENESRLRFYVSLQGISLPLSESKDHFECFLQKKNQPNSLMQWRPRDYRQTAKVFFDDNPDIMQLINEGALDEQDIFAIVKKYNLEKK